MRSATLLPVVLSLALATAPALAATRRPERVAVLICGGGGEQLLSRMLGEKYMPNLERLRASGIATAYMSPGYSAQEASAQATLWTGAYPDVNGVEGNRTPLVPAAQHTILEEQSGFSADALRAEPIFVSAARAGKQVVTLNLPQTEPLEAYAPGGRFAEGLGDRLTVFEGFSGVVDEEGLWSTDRTPGQARGWRDLPAHGSLPPLEWENRLGNQSFYALLIDDPQDPQPGYDTCYLTTERSGLAPVAVLKPAAPMTVSAWSGPVPVRFQSALGSVYFRLFQLTPDGRHVQLFHTAGSAMRTNRPSWLSTYYQQGTAFVPGGASNTYLRGGFGQTLAEGGDGTAEARYLDTVRFALHELQKGARALTTQHPWELFCDYVPFPAEIDQMWKGYLLPRSPSYLPGAAQTLTPAMRQVFLELDAFIGALWHALPPHTAFMVVGDAGMAPARWDFLPNVALKQAGLLVLDRGGHVDLSRTKAMYAPQNDGYVVVNSSAHQGGIVAPADVPAVLEAAHAALKPLMVKTPGGIVPLVRIMERPSPGLSREFGVPADGDRLYLELQPGYCLNPDWDGNGLYRLRPANATGIQPFQFRGPEREGVLYAVGDGIRRGALLPGIKQVDLAPTIASLLGIPAPAQSRGHVVSGALAK